MRQAIDFDAFKSLFSDVIVEGNTERYQFTWPDKRKVKAIANQQVTSTLRPCMEESVNFDTTENLYIEGDNLEVLKLLQETYLGKIKIIYIDPPYNTGHDFVYHDCFTQTERSFRIESGDYDKNGNLLVLNSNSDGRFHTNWLNMIYPRLRLAKDLLSDDGVMFISIDDTECANLKKICDEIFGEACFVCAAIWKSSDNSNNDAKQFSLDHNSILIYSKQSSWQPKKQFNEEKRKHFKNPNNDPKGPWFDGNPLNSPNYRENLIYDLAAPNGTIIKPPKNGWRWAKETLLEKIKNGEIYFNESQTNIKRRTYLSDMEGLPPSSLWIDSTLTGHNRQAKYELLKLMPENVFDTPKPIRLIKFIINLVQGNEDSIILDFFSGSGTTAEAVMQMNAEDNGSRKFILVQLPENLDDDLEKASNDNKLVLKNAISLCDKLGKTHHLSKIALERIRRAGKQILNELKEKNGGLLAEEISLDIGFRDLKLDSSNMNDIYYTPEAFSQDLVDSAVSNIKEDRTAEDLLFQVMLDLGIFLSSKIEGEEIAGKKIFNVADNHLIACFDEDVNEDVIIEAAKKKPTYFVMRDSSLSNDSVSVNFDQIFARYSPDTIRKVI